MSQIVDAIKAPVKELEEFTDALKKATGFVEALSPTTVLQFNEALRNFQAAVGEALAPLLQVGTQFFYDLSKAVEPLMQKLAPIVEELASVFADTLTDQLLILVDIIDLFLPVLQGIATAARAIADTFVIFTSLLRAIIEMIKSLLPDSKDGLASFKEVLQETVKSLTLMAAQLLIFAGQMELVNLWASKLEDRLKHEKSYIAAPRDVGLKSFQQIANDLAVAAAGATGVKPRSSEDFLADIARELRKITSSGKSWDQIILDALKAWWEIIRTKVFTVKIFGS